MLYIVEKELAGERLDAFVAKVADITRSSAAPAEYTAKKGMEASAMR